MPSSKTQRPVSNTKTFWVWSHTLVITALRMLRQEDGEFEININYIVLHSDKLSQEKRKLRATNSWRQLKIIDFCFLEDMEESSVLDVSYELPSLSCSPQAASSQAGVRLLILRQPQLHPPPRCHRSFFLSWWHILWISSINKSFKSCFKTARNCF